MSTTPLKLLAQSPEDLTIVSAMCQDAAVKMGDMAYLPAERRFAAAVNRYRWEDKRHRIDRKGSRIRSGLHIDYVLRAQTLDMPMGDADQVLELLALSFEPSEDGAGTILLAFAGDGTIRLDVECIEAALSDLTGPWAARTMPHHKA